MQLTAYCKIPGRAKAPSAGRPGFFDSSIWLGMKLTAIIILATFLQVSATGYSQVLNLNLKNARLEDAMKEIQRQSGYSFLYTKEDLKNARPVDVQLSNADLVLALTACFKDQPIKYNIDGKQIVLKSRSFGDAMLAYLSNTLKSIAPPKTLNGRVLNEQLGPLEGASVQIKGTRKGTLTGRFGEFSLPGIQVGTTLIVSYAGYTTREVVIGENNIGVANGLMLIALTPSVSELDQMQVIGYGQVTNRYNIGDVTTIKGEDIIKQPVINPLAALQGRVPGMDIRQVSGLPGGSFSVAIRGTNSITGSSAPLYIIDGVPYPGGILGSISSANANLRGGDGLNFLNPNDIESIAVLKDADATAIYGSRGSNGVVLITTKKGRPGKTAVSADVYSGEGKATRMPKYLNLQQYLAMRHEAKVNGGFPILPGDYDINGGWDSTRYTDWSKVFTGNTAHITDAQTSVSGGSENTQYYIGGGYHKESTIYPGDGADQKGSVHFNITNTSNDKRLNVQLTGSYVSDVNTVVPANLGYASGSVDLPPDAPKIYNPDGSLNWQNNTFTNPFAQLNLIYKAKTYNLVSNGVIGYRILKGLEAKVSLGYNSRQTSEFNGTPSTVLNPITNPASIVRTSIFNTYDTKTWNIEPQATYNTKIGQGSLSALAGATIQRTTTLAQSVTATGYSSDLLLQSLKAATKLTATNDINRLYKYSGTFGRLNYNWAGKYIAEFTGRYDGSSRFGPGRQFHFFGSAGAMWIFTEEKWVRNNISFLSFGRIRGDYGSTGNDGAADYQFMELFNSTAYPYQGAAGLYPANLYNPNLAWEVNKKAQVGLDLGFLKDQRILIHAGYSRNRSSSLLLSEPLSAVTGFSSITENLPALIQNTSWEFTLNTINIKTKNFTWSTYGTLTLPKNELISYPGLSTSGFANSLIVGQPLNIKLMYKYAGVDPQKGNYTFLDHTGKITYTPAPVTDQIAEVKLDPKYYGSLGNTFRYKNFTLDFLFVFSKRKANNVFGLSGFPPGFSQANVLASVVEDSWKKPGDNAKTAQVAQSIPALLAFSSLGQSDHSYSDDAYLRLKNVYLAYQLPAGLLKKMHVENIRVYVKGQNLLTISSFKDIDPETQSFIPPVRIVTGGIQINL